MLDMHKDKIASSSFFFVLYIKEGKCYFFIFVDTKIKGPEILPLLVSFSPRGVYSIAGNIYLKISPKVG